MNAPRNDPVTPSRRHWLGWTLAALVVAALVVLGWRSVAQRSAEQAARQSRPEAPVIALAPQDVAVVQQRRFQAEVPISGTLQAVHTATVKARVAGDLRDFSVREGDAVQAGQLIARIAPAEYDARLQQAEQQARASDAQAAVAQRQYDNNRALVDEGFISRTALANSRADLDAARANAKAAQAAAAAARKTLEDTQLSAPIAGQIAQRHVAPGDYVAPGAPVADIVDLDTLELRVPLSPSDSMAVRTGQHARVTVEGSPTPLDATVVRINPSTQAGSRSVLAYLQVPAADGLRQGLFAQGVLATGERDALLVPLSAIRSDRPQPYVQLVTTEPDGSRRIAHRNVTTGARTTVDGQTLVAVTGLADGDLVLRAAAGSLGQGTRVRLLDSNPSPD
ncbi:MAG: efflux RND transporter periplasmic adaptor subunit [Ottowia sp.]|nr:efflux RND transporter periplasmic adaptor subunit [Ottowia sp.]